MTVDDNHDDEIVASGALPPGMRWASPGFYGWFVVFIGWAALVTTFVDRLAWGNVALAASRSLGLPLAALGIFVTAFYIGYVAANVVGGVMTDRLGSRTMLASTMLLLGICTFLFGYVHSITAGLAIQVLMGLAAGADHAACIRLIFSWFDVRYRARAIGFIMTSVPVGVTLTNALIPTFLLSYTWNAVYQILGVVTAVAALVCYVTLRDGVLRVQPRGTSSIGQIRVLLKNRDVVLLAIAGFGGLWGAWGFTYLVNALMVKSHGLSLVVAGVITSLFGLSSIISKPLGGLVSDWLGGRRKVLSIGLLLVFSASLLIFGRLESVQSLRICAVVMGFAAFSWGPLMTAMIGEAAGNERVGSAVGLTNALWQLGGVIVPSLVGYVFATTRSFDFSFLLLAVGPLVGALTLFGVPETAAFGVPKKRSGRAEKANAVAQLD